MGSATKNSGPTQRNFRFLVVDNLGSSRPPPPRAVMHVARTKSCLHACTIAFARWANIMSEQLSVLALKLVSFVLRMRCLPAIPAERCLNRTGFGSRSLFNI